MKKKINLLLKISGTSLIATAFAFLPVYNSVTKSAKIIDSKSLRAVATNEQEINNNNQNELKINSQSYDEKNINEFKTDSERTNNTKTFYISNSNNAIRYSYLPDVVSDVTELSFFSDKWYWHDDLSRWTLKLVKQPNGYFKLLVNRHNLVNGQSGLLPTWSPYGKVGWFYMINSSSSPMYEKGNIDWNYANVINERVDKNAWKMNSSVEKWNNSLFEGVMLWRAPSWSGFLPVWKDPYNRFILKTDANTTLNAYDWNKQYQNILGRSFSTGDTSGNQLAQFVMSQYMFGLYDGKIWFGTNGSNYNIELKRIDISKNEFMNTISESTIGTFFDMNLINVPKQSVSKNGKSETKVFVEDRVADSVVDVTFTFPRQYRGKTNGSYNDNLRMPVFNNFNWIENSPRTLKVSIPYSKFSTQSTTSVKERINIKNINPSINGIDQYSYAIDLYSIDEWQKNLINSINSYPLNYMSNIPSAEEATGRPFVNPYYNTKFEMIENGYSIKVTTSLLFRGISPNDPAKYVETSFILEGFNIVETIVFPSLYYVSGSLSITPPSAITPSNRLLEMYLREKGTLSQIFDNVSLTFIEENHKKLRINSITKANDKTGELTVNVTAFNAKANSMPTGYANKNFDVVLRGFAREIGNTTLIPKVDINNLNISGIDKNLYSLDYVDSEEFRILQDNLNLYFSKYENASDFLEFPPTLNKIQEGQPIATNFYYEIDKKNQGDLKVTLDYLAYDISTRNVAYKNGSFILTGLNQKTTSVNSSISNTIPLVEFANSSLADITQNSPEMFLIRKYIAQNLTSLFQNYPKRFLQNNIENITTKILKKDLVNGILQVEVGLSNCFDQVFGYTNSTFVLSFSGFEPITDATTTKVISASSLAPILSENNNYDTFFSDLENRYAGDIVQFNIIRTKFAEQIKNAINNVPSFFFRNLPINSNQQVQPNSSLIIEQGNLPNSLKVTGSFKMKKNSTEWEYLEASIIIVDFNKRKTVASINQVDYIVSSILTKGTISSEDAACYLNGTYKAQLINSLNESHDVIFALSNLNVPQGIIDKGNRLFNEQNTTIVPDGVGQISINVKNIPFADENGLIHNNETFSIPISGFAQVSMNTRLANRYIDANVDLASFQELFGSNKGFAVDWQGTSLTYQSQLLFFSLNTYPSKFFLDYVNVDNTVRNVFIYNNSNTTAGNLSYNAIVYYNGFRHGVLTRTPLIGSIDITLRPTPTAKDFPTFNEFLKKEILKQKGPKDLNEIIDIIKKSVNVWINLNNLFLPDSIINLDPDKRVNVVSSKIIFDPIGRTLAIQNGAILIGTINSSIAFGGIEQFSLPPIDQINPEPIPPNTGGDNNQDSNLEILNSNALWIWVVVAIGIVAILILLFSLINFIRKNRSKKLLGDDPVVGVW